MKNILLILSYLIVFRLSASHQFMACLNKNGKSKLVKYGEKRGEKIDHQNCSSLWNKHSYQHGNVAVCQLKRHMRDRIDFYGRVHKPDNKSVADVCQEKYPLTAVKM